MYTNNLSIKKLTEFTTEDTIYITHNADSRKPLYLCQFISYNPKNATVTGKVIDTAGYGGHAMGNEITASYSYCALYGNFTDEQSNKGYYRYFDRSLYAMHPLEKHKLSETDLHVSEHPSYGMASFSRVSSSHGKSLFGSSIQNKQTITFQIKRASHDRNLSNDWYHGKQTLIEIEMSQTQFSELITSFNRGEGIPVTINYFEGEMYPEPPFQSKFDLFNAEFKKGLHNLTVDMKIIVDEATEILKNKTTINKADREKLLANVHKMTRFMADHLPFAQQQFVESMQDTVNEAKSQIEAFVEHKIRNTGLEALGMNKEDHTPLIELPQKDDDEKF